jgi:proteasome lid subunit RPN8/RPN11
MVQEVIPVTNGARSPVKYRMDPLEQLRAFNWIEDKGWELLGIFHSHPTGPVGPSATDIADAAYPVVYVIWSRTGGLWKAKGFWIEESRVSEVELYAADGEPAA